MLSQKDIENLIQGCRETAKIGLANGTKATIQELTIDFLEPPMDFLGLSDNPAIYISQDTYHLLGKFHTSWLPDQTIAVKKTFLKQPSMQVIGIIVHETGHAFNVAAQISNSEANAYIFEIEVLSRWLKEKNPLLHEVTESDLKQYFTSRLGDYRKATSHSAHLNQLVHQIEEDAIPNPETRLLKRTRSTPSSVIKKRSLSSSMCFFGECMTPVRSRFEIEWELTCYNSVFSIKLDKYDPYRKHEKTDIDEDTDRCILM